MPSQLHRVPTANPTAGASVSTPVTTAPTASSSVSMGNAATADRLSLQPVERKHEANTSAMHGELDWLRGWLNEGPKTPTGIQSEGLELPGLEVSAGKEGETENARGEASGTFTADSSGVTANGSASGEVDAHGVRLHGTTQLDGSENGLEGTARIGADKRFDNGVVVGITGDGKAGPEGLTGGATARVAHEGETAGVEHKVGVEHRVGSGTAATASATHSGDHHDLTGAARVDKQGAAASLTGRLKANGTVGETDVEGSIGGTLDTRKGAKADAAVTFKQGDATGSITADTTGRVRAQIGSHSDATWLEGEGWKVGSAEGGMSLGGERNKDGVKLDADANLALIAAEAKAKGERDLVSVDEYTATVDGSARAVVEARAQAKGSAQADTSGASVKGSLNLFAGAKAEAEVGGTLNWDRDDYTEDLKDFADILPGDWDDRMLDKIPDKVWRSASEILFGKGRTPLARAAIALDARAGAGAEARGELKTTNGGLMEAEAAAGAAVGVGAGLKTRLGINPLGLLRQGAVKGMEQANVLVGTVEGWLRKLRGKE